MNIASLLMLGGVFTAIYTVVMLSRFLPQDTGIAAGMFFGGGILSVIQLVAWSINK